MIGASGSVAGLETLYDINNPNGSLTVDAGSQVFLHQNDTFKSVTIGGVSLAPGLYTFTQLTNAYPANFPASWPPQRGSPVTTGSGRSGCLATPRRPLRCTSRPQVETWY